MILVFDNAEAEYLAWVSAHQQDGYVVNIDRARNISNYPMVHHARHGLISSARIGHFTTGEYIKICSTSLDALGSFAESMLRAQLTRCAHCFETGTGSRGTSSDQSGEHG